MTTRQRRMREDLQLRGLAPKTQEYSIAAVHQLAQHYQRSPDQLSEEEFRQYFLYLLTEKQVADSTFRMHLYGIRFFYERTLQRPSPVFTLPRELRALVRRNQKDLYDIWLRAAAQALLTLAADPHDVGGLIGVLCVLHTWTRALAYHPHVHGRDGSQDPWLPATRVSATREPFPRVFFITALMAMLSTDPPGFYSPSPPHDRRFAPKHLANLLVNRPRLY